jgi:DNA-binding NarL/FixJ family response regulator
MMPPFRTVLIDDHRIFSDGLNLMLRHSADFTVVAQVFEKEL